jgi:PLP dependent protein
METTISENLLNIKSSLPQEIKLVAVSKNHPWTAILEAYNSGQRCFGENKAQEMASKQSLLPNDIEWHCIGHLQTNKVKYIAPFVSMIHSVDSLRLLQVIDKEALKNRRVIRCLLQFHIAEEETKSGLSSVDAIKILESPEFPEMKNILISGVMGMATFTDEENQIRKEFRNLKSVFGFLRERFFADHPWFREISMGMSSDYRIAIEEGSTMVRIGSSIFGTRIR